MYKYLLSISAMNGVLSLGLTESIIDNSNATISIIIDIIIIDKYASLLANWCTIRLHKSVLAQHFSIISTLYHR